MSLAAKKMISKERSLKMELILNRFIEGSIPILLRTIESNLCHGAFFYPFFYSSQRLQGKNKAPQGVGSRASVRSKITILQELCYWFSYGAPSGQFHQNFLEPGLS
jgi:hypothetical protein